jgi:RNA polymerase sigma-70 factor (ECF subfamily)
MKAFSELPPEVRIVAILRIIEGFSYKEIAEALSCPIGTVMSRLHQGRCSLQRNLREYISNKDYLEENDNNPIVDLNNYLKRGRGPGR